VRSVHCIISAVFYSGVLVRLWWSRTCTGHSRLWDEVGEVSSTFINPLQALTHACQMQP